MTYTQVIEEALKTVKDRNLPEDLGDLRRFFTAEEIIGACEHALRKRFSSIIWEEGIDEKRRQEWLRRLSGESVTIFLVLVDVRRYLVSNLSQCPSCEQKTVFGSKPFFDFYLLTDDQKSEELQKLAKYLDNNTCVICGFPDYSVL